MKNITLLIILLLILSTKLVAHNWEMGLQVYKSDGTNFDQKHVFLYKSSGRYPYELHGDGWTTFNPIQGEVVNGESDYFFCDQLNQDFDDPLWDPIWPGSYVLRIDNKWCYFFVFPPDCEDPISQGSADFIIKYVEGGNFILELSSWAVSSISATYSIWDVVTVTFNQKKSDGSTDVGTLSIGEGSYFSPRTLAPFAPYVNKNQTYLFDADPRYL